MTLGLTFYLLGLAFGSLVMAPLSEMYGRKPVCVPSLFLFAVLIIPCARATSVAEIMVVRFLSAFFGSVMVSAAPGLVADVVNDEHRSLAISIWSIGPMNGPGMCWMFLDTSQPLCLAVDIGNSGYQLVFYSSGSNNWRVRDTVSKLEMDGLDHSDVSRCCAILCLYNEGNICSHHTSEEGCSTT